MNYRREIDGLRAVAVLPVILFHAGFDSFSGGFVGVDVFFVISGYLITTIILTEIEQGKFSLVNFYERRARRILPALFFVMFACIPFAWFWLLPSEMRNFSQSLVAVSIFASNIFYGRQIGYFASPAEMEPLLHTWSLAVEGQYYILFPVFFVLIWRLGKDFIFYIVAITAVISFAAGPLTSVARPVAAFYLLSTRGWEILIGALAALYLANENRAKYTKGAIEAGGLLGLTLILYAVFFYNKTTPYPGFYTLAPTLGSMLIVLFATQETRLGTLLANKAFVSVGVLSYGAYLWHHPLFVFARYKSQCEPSHLALALLSIVAFMLSYFSWKYVESSFRKTGFSSKKVLICFSSAAGLLVSSGLTGHLYNGLSSMRFSERQLVTVNSLSPSPKRLACHFLQNENSLSKTACRYFSRNVTVAVVGNSHATELSYSLADLLKNRNIGIAQHSMSGCAHNYNIISQAETVCGRWHNKILNEITNDKLIKYVVLSYRNEGYLNKLEHRKSLVDFSKALINAGKKVAIVLQAPRLKKSVTRYLTAAYPDFSGSHISRQLKDWQYLYSASHALLSELPPEVSVFDPADLFCKDSYCYATLNGIALYSDEHHMSLAGSKLVAEQIIQSFIKY